MANFRAKNPDRRKVDRRLHRHKTARLRHSERLLVNPDDVEARRRFEEHTASIKSLKRIRQILADPTQFQIGLGARMHVPEKKEHKGRFGSHAGHTSLVVSSSRHGPMLYVFCREEDCRKRVLKASSLVISGLSAREAIGGIAGECEHREVVLKRARHFDISATCPTCGQSSVVRNVFVESWSIVSKANTRRGGGDSVLPRGDPRLLKQGHIDLSPKNPPELSSVRL